MTKSTGKRRMWTEEDTATARRLFNKLQNYKAVAQEMGRSPSTVQEWLQGLRGPGRIKRKHIEKNDLITVPAACLEDRTRRDNLTPRDITAMLMGDPLPGYSALERRH